MKSRFLLILLLAFSFYFSHQISVLAEEQHQHEENGHDENSKDDHADHDEDEQGEESEESTGGVGPNNAVTAADEQKGIQFSNKAEKAIGLKTESYQNGSLPVTALVRHQNQISVYRLREGWYKRVPVQIEKIEDGQAVVQAGELNTGDFVVIQGVALLRVAELDAFSGEVGHSH